MRDPDTSAARRASGRERSSARHDPSSTWRLRLEHRDLLFLLSGFALFGLLVFAGGLVVGTFGIESPEPTKSEGLVPIEPPRALPLPPQPALPPPAAREAPPPSLDLSASLVEAPSALDPGSPRGTEGEESSPASPEKLIYELQLGLFFRFDDTRSMIADLEGKGHEPYVVEVWSSLGEVRYTIRLGPYPDQESAADEGRALLSEEGLESVIRYRSAASRAS